MIGGRLHEIRKIMKHTGDSYEFCEQLSGRGLMVVGDYDEDAFVGFEFEGKAYVNMKTAQILGKAAKPFKEITGMIPYVSAVLYSY
jgi:hypothetical protein